MYCFRVDTRKWTRLKFKGSSIVPPARVNFAASVVNNRLYIFAGSTTAKNDMYYYDFGESLVITFILSSFPLDSFIH